MGGNARLGLGLAAVVGAVAVVGGLIAQQRSELRALSSRVDQLQAEVPDQSAIMTIEAFQFSNLWFAIKAENWPLAEFFVNEARKDLRWAISVKPHRTTLAGRDIDIASIGAAVDQTVFQQLKDAILQKDRPLAEQRYRETLSACSSCHQAAERPFIRPQIPTAPQTTLLDFDSSPRSPH
jgi:hypothetical protein